ncbi:MBG domain-containing protein [Geotalea sp. SG265]|uniref:beta strand repeat-containing protein n=1 Tax=Geotalea sp. SG265 TaxID=2922867 RepID=UPI001FAEE707|nr:MBG domain-containing protein [Geotalea sp. SG265]
MSSATSCHANLASTGTITTAINGTAGTTVTVPAGGTFEIDWIYNNMAGSKTDDAPMIAIPTGWGLAPGTANNPALTGWNSIWDVADGVTSTATGGGNGTATNVAGWNTGHMVDAGVGAGLEAFTIDYVGGTNWGTSGEAADDGGTNDADGTANKMGTDARIIVPAGTTPGTYKVDVYGIGHTSTNKAYIKQTITVTVTAAVVKQTPTINSWPTASAITYGQALSSSTLTGGSASVPGTFAWINPTTVPAVGAPAQAVRFTPTDTTNYNTVDGTVAITVNPKPLTITAAAKSKVYGAADPALTYTATGLVGSDTTSGSLARVAGEDVGTYAINQGTVTAGANYAITYVGANLTITAKPLTITAAAKSKVYGAADPALTYTATGLVGSDTTSGSLTRAAGENAGTYAISQGTVTAGTNYTITYVGANLTITPAPITVTADPKTKIVGSADPALTYTITSGALVGSDAFSGALSRDPGETVGLYAIRQNTLALNSNYTLTYVGNNLEITAAPKQDQTITFNPLAAVTYGNGDFNPGATASSGLTVSYTSSNTAVATIIGGQVHIVGVGTTTITASQAGDATYNPAANVSQPLTVNKAALTVTADSSSKTYGAANPALGVSYAGFVGTDSAASLTTQPTASTSATASSPAGTYAVNATGGVSNNYSFTYVAGTLTINKAALTVTANNASKSYGAVNPALSVAYSGFVLGETATNLTTQPVASTTATASSPAGTYAITAAGGVSNNYTFTYVTGTLTVNKADLTVTANNAAKTYGASNPVLSLNYAGFVSGENEASLTTQPTASTTAVVASPVGLYPINVAGGVSSNYNFIYVAGTLSVNKAALTVTANNASKTYGTANPALTVAYTGFVLGESAANLTTQPTATTTATASSPAGTYAIAAAGGASNNYNFTYVAGTLTVDKAALTVTANNASKTYGAANPALSVAYTGFVLGETAANLTTQPTATTTATASSPAGTYAITAAGGASNNYNFTYVAGTLTVDKAALTVTANNAGKTYGSANPTLSVAYSGFVLGETVANLTTQPTATTTATASSPAGTYAITAAGGASNNYNFTYVAGTLTVDKAALTVTANNTSKTYGAANPALTVAYSGFVLGETVANLTTQPTATTTATASSPAGTYGITAAGGASNNYNFTYVAGTLTVDKAALTVTANNTSKTYGAANPALSVAYTGFVLGETATNLTTQPTPSTTATASSPAGTYPITAAGGASNNYNFTYVAGTLTVNKAPLSVTANNASKTYGAANPALSVAYTGFVLGETAVNLTTQPAASTTATASSPAGTYPITAAGGASNNYAFTYVAGTLTVNKAPLTVTANNASKTYGAANPALTIAYAGFVLGETAANLTTQPTVSTTATAASPAGTYPITAAGGVSSNYAFTYAAGTLTVDKAVLTVTADDQTRVVGAPDPIYTATYSGFVAGDTSAVVSGAPIFSTTATAASPAGTYPITPTQGNLAADNYTFTFVNGTLTITATASTYNLAVAKAGAGNGTINSNPVGIACDGANGCNFDFASGIVVTLTATPDSKSLFTGWSGACTGTGTCAVTMDAAKNVTATFDVNPLVKVGGTLYATILDAYTAALDGAVIEVRDVLFSDFSTFDRPISITFDGGKDSSWNKTTGFTTLTGPVTFGQGSVTVDGLVIE